MIAAYDECQCRTAGVSHEHHVGTTCNRLIAPGVTSVCRGPHPWHTGGRGTEEHYRGGASGLSPIHVSVNGWCSWCSCRAFADGVAAAAVPAVNPPGGGFGTDPQTELRARYAEQEAAELVKP